MLFIWISSASAAWFPNFFDSSVNLERNSSIYSEIPFVWSIVTWNLCWIWNSQKKGKTVKLKKYDVNYVKKIHNGIINSQPTIKRRKNLSQFPCKKSHFFRLSWKSTLKIVEYCRCFTSLCCQKLICKRYQLSASHFTVTFYIKRITINYITIYRSWKSTE